jgi:hypothetical protein
MYSFGYLIPASEFTFDGGPEHDYAGELHVITGAGVEISGSIYEPVVTQRELPDNRPGRFDQLEKIADSISDEAHNMEATALRNHRTRSCIVQCNLFQVNDTLTADDDPVNVVNEIAEKIEETSVRKYVNSETFVQYLETVPEIRRTRSVRPGAVQMVDGRSYIPRRIHGVRDIDFLRSCRTRQLYPLLSGEPGTGKTTANEAAFGEELLTVNCTLSMAAADLIGQYVPVPEQPGSFNWVDGPLVTAMVEGRPLLIDDVTAMPEEVQNILLPVVDHRRHLTVLDRPGESDIHAADGFWVSFTQNPGTGFGLTKALASRISVTVDVPMELSIAKDLGADPQLLAIARQLEQRKVQDKDRVLEHWVPDFRCLMDATEIGSLFGVQAGAVAMRSECPSREKDLNEFLDHMITDAFGEALPKHLVSEV